MIVRELGVAVAFRGRDVVGPADLHDLVNERVPARDEPVTERVQGSGSVEVGGAVLGIRDGLIHFLVRFGGGLAVTDETAGDLRLFSDVFDRGRRREVVDGEALFAERLDLSRRRVRCEHEIRIGVHDALDTDAEPLGGDVRLLACAVEVRGVLRHTDDRSLAPISQSVWAADG